MLDCQRLKTWQRVSQSLDGVSARDDAKKGRADKATRGSVGGAARGGCHVPVLADKARGKYSLYAVFRFKTHSGCLRDNW